MKQKFINIRKDILKLSKITGQGRLGTDYSVVELIDTVYQHMRHDPNNPSWDDRDIFVLSKGHASLCYYTILAHNGYFSLEEVKRYSKNWNLYSILKTMIIYMTRCLNIRYSLKDLL